MRFFLPPSYTEMTIGLLTVTETQRRIITNPISKPTFLYRWRSNHSLQSSFLLSESSLSFLHPFAMLSVSAPPSLSLTSTVCGMVAAEPMRRSVCYHHGCFIAFVLDVSSCCWGYRGLRHGGRYWNNCVGESLRKAECGWEKDGKMFGWAGVASNLMVLFIWWWKNVVHVAWYTNYVAWRIRIAFVNEKNMLKLFLLRPVYDAQGR